MSIINFIGNTPLLRVFRHLFLKLEYMNPSGSVKDRAAKNILLSNDLPRGSKIAEATSGNFGISLAMISAAMGYDFTAFMPRTASLEREKIIRAYGGRVIRTDGMADAVEMAAVAEGFKPRQFENPMNLLAHYDTTGPEIWRDTEGRVDILVSGVGSAGTIMGTGRYLREKNPGIKLVAVMPREKKHKIEGIGAGFSPPLYERELVSEEILVSDSDAVLGVRNLMKKHGIFAGISSGAAYFVAEKLMKSEENQGKNIVAILPDSADRYFSSHIF